MEILNMAVSDLEAVFESALAADTGDVSGDSSEFQNLSNADINFGDDLDNDDGLGIEQPADDGDDADADDVDLDDDGDTDADIDADPDEDDGDDVGEFDWSSEADKLVTVKVDGKPVRVPLKEAMAGYMRQADYTRKTQSVAEEARLAQWAREMQQAITADPQGTVLALQQALGLAPSGKQAVSQETDPLAALADDPELKPLIETLRAQQAEIQRLRQGEAQRVDSQILEQVKAEIATVANKYADFDATVILPIAEQKGLTVLDAYKLWKADQVEVAEQARADAAKKAAKKADIQRKAAEAAAVSRKGGKSTRTSDGEVDPSKFDSFEALLMANMARANRKK